MAMVCASGTKFAAMAVLWLLWLAVVEASIHRTTVRTTETVTVEDDKVEFGGEWPAPIRCQSEQMELDECRSYVKHGSEGMILLGFGRGGSSHRPPQQCCQQLRETRKECRCEAIRQLVSGESQRREDLEGREEEKRIKRAENLPRTCGLSHHHCAIHPPTLSSI